jgi:hypothetical protein
MRILQTIARLIAVDSVIYSRKLAIKTQEELTVGEFESERLNAELVLH